MTDPQTAKAMTEDVAVDSEANNPHLSCGGHLRRSGDGSNYLMSLNQEHRKKYETMQLRQRTKNA